MRLAFFFIILSILILYYSKQKEIPIFMRALAPECKPITASPLPDVVFSKNSDGTYTATVGGKSKLQFMCNLDVTSSAIKPTKVFQMVHGMTRDMKGYFSMANNAWGRGSNILVWAPRFPIQSEILDSSYNYWSQMSAVTGDASNGPSNMTSFEFLDAINGAFFKLYSITVAVLAGHSFGGQLSARYTGLSYLPELFPKVKIYYCILSPSSFLWIVPERPNPSSSCGNNWFYGLDRLNVYANKMGANNIYCNYMNRNVIVMCGTNDTASAMLDQSCAANTQGANRYERAKNFVALMEKLGAKNFQYEYFNGGHGTNLKGKILSSILN
jgi:hypothetical protein